MYMYVFTGSIPINKLHELLLRHWHSSPNVLFTLGCFSSDFECIFVMPIHPDGQGLYAAIEQVGIKWRL